MDFLRELGIVGKNSGCSTGREWLRGNSGKLFPVSSPVDGKKIAEVFAASPEDYETLVQQAEEGFRRWRTVPAPKRGEIIRQIGLKMREYKDSLGRLIAYEMGKSLQEGLGEVQEMIDICDFAVGQSRMLYGFTIASERPRHRMYDQYHPLGIVGIITAFNFPLAVWAWNAMIAAVCGDVTLWKPSSQTPLTAIAAQKLIGTVLQENDLPEGIFSLAVGSGNLLGESILKDRRIPLVSFTGSIPTGRHVAEEVAKRFGKTILELGGNNAVILTPEADLKLALPAVVFGAAGTAGQRCTTTRRLIVHAAIYDHVKETLIGAYKTLRIGNPLDETHHVGPLIDGKAVTLFTKALDRIRSEGGRVLFGGERLSGTGYESGCYVRPAIVEVEAGLSILQEETFVPILYLIRYDEDLAQAIKIHNAVPQGLSSSIFTKNLREAETFLSTEGSDCGIANVNVGTSGAEIGGAFGGEKETGGGREAGADAWKNYMRRQTVTINFGEELPLAQGIRFRTDT